MQSVTFPSNGLKIAAHLYLPAGAGPHAAIVVGHPGSSVKEQSAGLYARHLAELGYIALAFDAAHQGESEGLPRGLEDPAQRVEDFKAAVSYLTTRADVDPQRIGALGICASGGYVTAAGATDHRIQAVATVSAADIGRHLSRGADGQQSPAVLQTLLDTAAAARTAEARGDSLGALPLFPADAEQARAGGLHSFEGWEYYCTPRGEHPRSARTLTWDSVDRIAGFDAFHFIHLIAPRPLLMIVGGDAITAWMSEEAMAQAREPKQLHRIDGATHVDLYDRKVAQAIDKLAGFFGQQLASRREEA
ncbi:hypothetical protein FHW58_003191 [Duganella sp. 1224]|uniref:alpha/beta hydrolase n=1 Tax=Duganella sp. 1224 TaxID=2587052 RepID=UPI0015CA70A1|nr:alpha/beta hydrolase [Duganella sp. 1224]NYE61984.1 hypothetical protein [Duganella sp. 1224]